MIKALGPCDSSDEVDSVGVLESDLYMSGMHGGHGTVKSSFKRCLFLKHVGTAEVVDALVATFQDRPSPLCYLHILQVGGTVSDVAADETAFGCRTGRLPALLLESGLVKKMGLRQKELPPGGCTTPPRLCYP